MNPVVDAIIRHSELDTIWRVAITTNPDFGRSEVVLWRSQTQLIAFLHASIRAIRDCKCIRARYHASTYRYISPKPHKLVQFFAEEHLHRCKIATHEASTPSLIEFRVDHVEPDEYGYGIARTLFIVHKHRCDIRVHAAPLISLQQTIRWLIDSLPTDAWYVQCDHTVDVFTLRDAAEARVETLVAGEFKGLGHDVWINEHNYKARLLTGRHMFYSRDRQHLFRMEYIALS